MAKQSHRGQHPQDARLFAEKHIPALRKATADLSFLLSRRYAQDAALKLVGDHYQLKTRQRRAVLRAACPDASVRRRALRQAALEQLEGQTIRIDGYNLLIFAESALAGGILLRGRDGCVRDMASVHGSYRKVAETIPAIRLLGEVIEELGVDKAVWLLDAPVSNSGRLKKKLLEEAQAQQWQWEAQAVTKVDQRLSASKNIVITSDSAILDRAQRWAYISDRFLSKTGAENRVIDLAAHPGPEHSISNPPTPP